MPTDAKDKINRRKVMENGGSPLKTFYIPYSGQPCNLGCRLQFSFSTFTTPQQLIHLGQLYKERK